MSGIGGLGAALGQARPDQAGLVVAHARSDPGEHLPLPVGEYPQHGGVDWLGWTAPGDAGDQRAG